MRHAATVHWPFDQQFGFRPTGEIDDGGIVLRLDLSGR
jgi:diamine N-acetyltransferase